MSHLVRTARFYGNLHQVRSKSRNWKDKLFKVLGAKKKPKCLLKSGNY